MQDGTPPIEPDMAGSASHAVRRMGEIFHLRRSVVVEPEQPDEGMSPRTEHWAVSEDEQRSLRLSTWMGWVEIRLNRPTEASPRHPAIGQFIGRTLAGRNAVTVSGADCMRMSFLVEDDSDRSQRLVDEVASQTAMVLGMPGSAVTRADIINTELSPRRRSEVLGQLGIRHLHSL